MGTIYKDLGVNFDVSFYLIFYSLVWVRTLMMVSVTPFLFSKPVPKYMAVAISAVLAMFVAPYLLPKVPPTLGDNILFLGLLYLKEIFLGLTIGFTIAVFFYAFQSAGQMIDNQRGASIARILIPQLGTQGSIFGTFLFQLGIVMFLAIGGHRVFLEAFFTSFKNLPVLGFPSAGMHLLPMIDMFMDITSGVFLTALQLATPVIIAILMVDIVLGITNRFAPQINVWQLGFNIRGYIGMLMLFLSLLAVTTEMQKHLKKGNSMVKQLSEIVSREPSKPPKDVINQEGIPKDVNGVQKVKTVPSGE